LRWKWHEELDSLVEAKEASNGQQTNERKKSFRLRDSKGFYDPATKAFVPYHSLVAGKKKRRTSKPPQPNSHTDSTPAHSSVDSAAPELQQQQQPEGQGVVEGTGSGLGVCDVVSSEGQERRESPASGEWVIG